MCLNLIQFLLLLLLIFFFTYISGLSNQGNDALYYKNAQRADKGHLNPVKINTFDQNHVKATFTYSNAVPQYLGFNRGEWKKFEGLIVNYVQTKCAAKTPTGGEMYLMTGTSNFRLQIGAAIPTQDPMSPVGQPWIKTEVLR